MSRVPVPDAFDETPFTVGDGYGRGLSRKRMRGSDVSAPLRGVRSMQPVETRLAMLRAASLRLRPWQAFAGTSAAALWGLPVPARFERTDAPVVVAAPLPRAAPRAAGFDGIRITPSRFARVLLDGLPLTSPLSTWMLCARELPLLDLVKIGDALVTPSRWYPRRNPSLPVFDVDELRRAVEAWGAAAGAPALRTALERIRVGVDSPMETELRLALVDGGVPEPVIHHPVRLRSGETISPDLALPSLRIAFEYEGDQHRGQEQFRYDVDRYGEAADVGWEVVRVVSTHLRPSTRAFVARVHRLIRRRVDGWGPPH